MNRGPADHPLERGIAILSLDTEQIWGHLDLLDESKFEQQYRQAPAAHYRLLRTFCSAGVGATWFVVGGMSLDASDGPQDPRMAGLPDAWVGRVPAGSEASRPLWYHRSFIEALRDARPRQEIGLHGGLTHLIWTHPQSTREVVKRELAQGMKALEQISVRPRSFSFGRDQEAYHDLLPPHGIRCYRGRTPVLAYRLGRTIPGAVMRILDELREATPPPVWPRELQP